MVWCEWKRKQEYNFYEEKMKNLIWISAGLGFIAGASLMGILALYWGQL